MTITEKDMAVYDFGEHKLWPKPELKTPFEILRWHNDLLEQLRRLEQYATIRGRIDHFVKDLDTLQFALKDALFKSMVLRETLTGQPTRGAEE